MNEFEIINRYKSEKYTQIPTDCLIVCRQQHKLLPFTPAATLRLLPAMTTVHGAKGTPGLEPETSRSAVECSTAELYPLARLLPITKEL